jgi:hypothetical protein
MLRIEYRLAGKREPILAPSVPIVPPRSPQVTVIADNEEIEVTWAA